jgi:hypothetical protein
MAALPVIPNVFRVAVRWNGGAPLTAVNVMHFQKATGTSDALNAALQTNFTAAMWGALIQAAAIYELDIIPLDGSSATSVYTVPVGLAYHGGTAGEGNPSAAVLVKLQTGLRGRSHRGRLFLPFPGESASGNGLTLPSSVTGMQSAWDTFKSAMNTAGYVWGVASYTLGTFSPITTLKVEAPLGTQRRRQSRIRRANGF